MQSVIEMNIEMASENTYNPGRRNIPVNYKSDQEFEITSNLCNSNWKLKLN